MKTYTVLLIKDLRTKSFFSMYHLPVFLTIRYNYMLIYVVMIHNFIEWRTDVPFLRMYPCWAWVLL